jgi:hypothetical protein
MHDYDAMAETMTTTTTAMADEEFTVSPLVEYLISTSGEHGVGVGDDANDDAIGKASIAARRVVEHDGGRGGGTTNGGGSTLVPCGPRLVPPVGLNGIYTLQFHNTNHCDNDDGEMAERGTIPPWVAGAGKSGIVALWNCRPRNVRGEDNGGGADGGEDRYLDPIISWKGHGGRWIADARFLSVPPPSHSSPPPPDDTDERSAPPSSSFSAPKRLLTAGNDGTVCHWDLTSTSVKTGMPRLLRQSNKALHASGIFSMDVRDGASSSSVYCSGETRIVTGSKDKTIAISTLCRLDDRPIWRSDFHSAKVGSVCFSSNPIDPLVASASDDGLVAVHDARVNGMRGGGGGNGVATKLENAHSKPHSAIWMPGSDGVFVTGGYALVLYPALSSRNCA